MFPELRWLQLFEHEYRNTIELANTFRLTLNNWQEETVQIYYLGNKTLVSDRKQRRKYSASETFIFESIFQGTHDEECFTMIDQW